MQEERQVEHVTYEYEGKSKSFDLVICDKQIATVCRRIDTDIPGVFDIEILSEGMTYEEILKNFPPRGQKKKKGRKKKKESVINFESLIRSIIYEAYVHQGTDREEGNVRNFWYTNIKFIVEDILKLGETNSVKTAINTSWGKMINSELVTYEGMNVVSGKEKIRHSVIRDSPFANIIVGAEKEDLFDPYKWIPKLFNCTLIASAGESSRVVARAFVKDLKDNGVDLNQRFFMPIISDLDPAGYYIQNTYRAQLEKAIVSYGGTGKIELRRLFVRRDQVTARLLKYQAMKCEDINAMKESARKAANTKWEYFCRATDGGLYKSKGELSYKANFIKGWSYMEEGIHWQLTKDDQVAREGTSVSFLQAEIDAELPNYIGRVKLELNAFGKEAIERQIVVELLKIILETSDESLIMIPEVMRIFDKQRLGAIEDMFNQHKDDWLQPFIDAFLSETEDLENELDSTTRTERVEASQDYNDMIEPIVNKYQYRRGKVDNNIDDKVSDQETVIEEYEQERGFDKTRAWIQEMREMLDNLEEHIDDEVRDYCADNYEEMKRLEEIRDKVKEYLDQKEKGEIEPHKKDYDEVLADIKERDNYRMEELEKYRRWKGTLFNPVEMELHRRIERPMSMERLDLWFRDLEGDQRTQPHITLLMSNPELLLEDNISAWDQDDIPVFKEEDLLQKASKVRDENVEAHRRGFTSDFLEAMKSIALEKGEDIEIEYPETPEFEDISKELEDLHDRIEKDIEDDKHKPEEEDSGDEDDEDDGKGGGLGALFE